MAHMKKPHEKYVKLSCARFFSREARPAVARAPVALARVAVGCAGRARETESAAWVHDSIMR
jgi:hypothetical protein